MGEQTCSKSHIVQRKRTNIRGKKKSSAVYDYVQVRRVKYMRLYNVKVVETEIQDFGAVGVGVKLNRVGNTKARDSRLWASRQAPFSLALLARATLTVTDKLDRR